MHILRISNKIFAMDFSRGDHFIYDKEDILPAYQEWGHAEVRLDGPASTIDRKDCLLALNRAVLHRINILNRRYHLKKIPGMDPKAGNTIIMHKLGLARGSVLDLLRNLRNRVEHDLSEPPEQKECNLYLDAVWYFLRSTDRLVVEVASQIEVFHPETQDEPMSIYVSFPEWRIYIDGDLNLSPASFVDTSSHDEGASGSIQIGRISERGIFYKMDPLPEKVEGFLHIPPRSEFVNFGGEVKGDDFIFNFAKAYFSTYY